MVYTAKKHPGVYLDRAAIRINSRKSIKISTRFMTQRAWPSGYRAYSGASSLGLSFFYFSSETIFRNNNKKANMSTSEQKCGAPLLGLAILAAWTNSMSQGLGVKTTQVPQLFSAVHIKTFEQACFPTRV